MNKHEIVLDLMRRVKFGFSGAYTLENKRYVIPFGKKFGKSSSEAIKEAKRILNSDEYIGEYSRAVIFKMNGYSGTSVFEDSPDCIFLDKWDGTLNDTTTFVH